MKYSVWLLPSSEVSLSLQKVIEDLAVRYGGPSFEPHITVASGIEGPLENVIHTVETIAEQFQPFMLTSTEVSFSTTYFQSVLLRIQSGASLLELNVALKEKAGVPNELYMPHISLMYGNHDMQTREQIAQEVSLPPLDFPVEKMVIVPMVPDPKDWKHQAEIPFRLASQ